MIVRCPECSTDFKLPDEHVSDEPIKVQCSRCEHVFRVGLDSNGELLRYTKSGERIEASEDDSSNPPHRDDHNETQLGGLAGAGSSGRLTQESSAPDDTQMGTPGGSEHHGASSEESDPEANETQFGSPTSEGTEPGSSSSTPSSQGSPSETQLGGPATAPDMETSQTEAGSEHSDPGTSKEAAIIDPTPSSDVSASKAPERSTESEELTDTHEAEASKPSKTSETIHEADDSTSSEFDPFPHADETIEPDSERAIVDSDVEMLGESGGTLGASSSLGSRDDREDAENKGNDEHVDEHVDDHSTGSRHDERASAPDTDAASNEASDSETVDATSQLATSHPSHPGESAPDKASEREDRSTTESPDEADSDDRREPTEPEPSSPVETSSSAEGAPPPGASGPPRSSSSPEEDAPPTTAENAGDSPRDEGSSSLDDPTTLGTDDETSLASSSSPDRDASNWGVDEVDRVDARAYKRSGRRAVPITLAVLLVINIGLGFIAFQNNWFLDFKKFGQMLSVAFQNGSYTPREAWRSPESNSDPAPPVRDPIAFEQVFLERVELNPKDNSGTSDDSFQILVLKGRARNQRDRDFVGVKLRGEIHDTTGKLLREETVPLGADLSIRSIAKLSSPEAVDSLYPDAPRPLKARQSQPFTIVFSDLPKEVRTGSDVHYSIDVADKSTSDGTTQTSSAP